MTSELPPVGVVIVHYARPAVLERCLRSVQEDPSRAERTIVVVDNSAGRDGGLDPTRLSPEVQLVSSPENLGFGRGANLGVEHLRRRCEPELYVIMNHDVEVLPGYLDAARRTLRGGLGAAAGPVYLDRADGQLWYAGGRIRYLTGTVDQSRSRHDAARARDVGFLTGAAFAVSAPAWRQIGGFNPRIFLYHEDVDISLSLRRAGWRLGFCPEMRAVHHMGAATGSRKRSAFYLEHMTRTRLSPYRSRLYKSYLALLHTPYVALRALATLAREGREGMPKARALARGHRAALKEVWASPHQRPPRAREGAR